MYYPVLKTGDEQRTTDEQAWTTEWTAFEQLRLSVNGQVSNANISNTVHTRSLT